jgi:hypothetical protein
MKCGTPLAGEIKLWVNVALGLGQNIILVVQNPHVDIFLPVSMDITIRAVSLY